MVGACLIWAVLSFGDPRYAWLYAGGARYVVEGAPIEVSPGASGEHRDAAFLVRNLSIRPIVILGVDSSCGCAESTEKVPIAIPAGGVRELRLTLHLEKSGSESIRQVLTYHTDEPTAPKFMVTVFGRVVDP